MVLRVHRWCFGRSIKCRTVVWLEAEKKRERSADLPIVQDPFFMRKASPSFLSLLTITSLDTLDAAIARFVRELLLNDQDSTVRFLGLLMRDHSNYLFLSSSLPPHESPQRRAKVRRGIWGKRTSQRLGHLKSSIRYDKITTQSFVAYFWMFLFRRLLFTYRTI